MKLIGACEYGKVIFLWTRLGGFMFHLNTMELKKLFYGSTLMSGTLYAYESFFSPTQVRTIYLTSFLSLKHIHNFMSS